MDALKINMATTSRHLDFNLWTKLGIFYQYAVIYNIIYNMWHTSWQLRWDILFEKCKKDTCFWFTEHGYSIIHSLKFKFENCASNTWCAYFLKLLRTFPHVLKILAESLLLHPARESDFSAGLWNLALAHIYKIWKSLAASNFSTQGNVFNCSLILKITFWPWLSPFIASNVCIRGFWFTSKAK